MEIKKCSNCGAFITTQTNFCDACLNKMNYDMTLLKNYFDETPSFDSISTVSATTGISPKSIEQYMQMNHYEPGTNTTSFNSIEY